MNILGISAFYHDSAAALLMDGKIVAAAQEERYTRKKHDSKFPSNAVRYCIDSAGISLSDIDYVVFYDKPLIKFERLLETYLAYAPQGFKSFRMAMPVWLKEKLFIKRTIRSELEKLEDFSGKSMPKLLFNDHHCSHAASAFYPSPFKKAAVICLDGVGEWATSTVWVGDGSELTPKWEIHFPHSLGLLYSAFTYYTGFKVNSGEYKLMGLAPYGQPKYVGLIMENLIDVKDDGTFKLNMQYFNYATGLTMTNKKFDQLFGGPPREPESDLTQREMDIAASIQSVTEEIVIRLARAVREEFDVENLCLAGGVALNCVANGKLLREHIFDNLWIQPAAGDAGGALGAALHTWHAYLGNGREPETGNDSMLGSFLGNKYSNTEIKAFLDTVEAPFEEFDDNQLFARVADILAEGNVVGWFSGRMEFGPRALGSRSILGDAQSKEMQKVMNLKIKYRESFRPFAPAILREKVSEWFEIEEQSPYMLLVAEVRDEKRLRLDDSKKGLFGIEKLNVARSEVPAITHVDFSARVQTVTEQSNSRFYKLLKAFENRSGCPILVNTSFNVRGEPIVCGPEDAYRCFMRTEMDYLVLENVVLTKSEQPESTENSSWMEEFGLD